ncbi:MAG: 50S ribosomal protein L10 [Deltaproteobacteria bacterium]|nr:50S ribosomal protein L10 [Deltaproteobacteria bacterium]MBT8375130.1 50S ribosomal protein L10 [Deltaproteobacteria bacterium]NNK86453.1 50S ribosomal protein L10 [Desulfobacterales bacterium]
MKIDEKKRIVEDLHEKFSNSKVVILTDYKGLDVDSINDLRRKLRELQIQYQVVKNSLLIRASKDTDVELIKDSFKGPSAVALGFDDPVSPAKVLTDFASENEMLEIKVGVMNGKVLDISSIKALSSLPTREVLLGQLLSVMNGVPTGFVRALVDVQRRFLNVMMAIKEQKEAA